MALPPDSGMTKPACDALGVSRASVHRRRARLAAPPAMVRPQPTPARVLVLKQDCNYASSTLPPPWMGEGHFAEMVRLIDPPLTTARAEAALSPLRQLVQDRRRPGRVAQVSPALIPLLRDPAHYVDTDPLTPARGVMVALLVSVPLWTLIGLAVWLFF